MKVQDWIFSIRFVNAESKWCRYAVVGPARASTVEAALHLAAVPEAARVEIREHKVVRDFVEGSLDPDKSGHYVERVMRDGGEAPWLVCIGSIQEVLR